MTIDDAEHYTAEERAHDHCELSSAREGSADQGHSGSGLWPHLPGHRGKHQLRTAGASRRTGRASAAWILAGTIPLRRLNWSGIVTPTRSMSPSTHRHASKLARSCMRRRFKPWGKLPWAWPRDGRRETLEGAGVALSKQYAEQGLDMLHEHAQFDDGSVSVEAGLMEMLTRMQTGRFKVFKHLNDWFEEFRLYHRKDGKVVKEGDDLMAATRYA